MNDVELLKRLQKISSDLRFEELKHELGKLKEKIETDIFLCEMDLLIEYKSEHLRNLEFIDNCIEKFEKKILTPDEMKEINILNKKYKRNI